MRWMQIQSSHSLLSLATSPLLSSTPPNLLLQSCDKHQPWNWLHLWKVQLQSRYRVHTITSTMWLSRIYIITKYDCYIVHVKCAVLPASVSSRRWDEYHPLLLTYCQSSWRFLLWSMWDTNESQELDVSLPRLDALKMYPVYGDTSSWD